MAKVKVKGMIVKHTISAALTAIAQIIGIDLDGCGSITYDSTTIDGGVYKTYDQTGYSEPGKLNLELFLDPALAGHQFITDLIAAPADNAMQITYADSGATTQSFTQSGIEFGVTAAMNDGLKASVSYQIDGDPGWPT